LKVADGEKSSESRGSICRISLKKKRLVSIVRRLTKVKRELKDVFIFRGLKEGRE